MKVALIADVHANLPALEAVLHEIRRHHVERIISLGDQVNLGPCPKETLALLKSENVACLHGNHERYILSAMDGDPAYAGANFNALRFNAARLSREDITFPKEMRVGCALLTHAMPGDDRYPVYRPEMAVQGLMNLNADAPKHIICGHGHNPTYTMANGHTLHGIGSVGCMDDGVPGIAPYTIAYIDEHSVSLQPYIAKYDPARLRPLFISSGMAEFCPIMARIACMEMTDNQEYLVKFASRASARAKEKGEPHVSMDTWEEIDRTFDWPDGKTAAQYWRR